MVQILNLNTYIHEKKETKNRNKNETKQNKTKQKKQKTKQQQQQQHIKHFYYVHRFSKKMRPSHYIYINRLGLGFFLNFFIKIFVHFCKFVFSTFLV